MPSTDRSAPSVDGLEAAVSAVRDAMGRVARHRDADVNAEGGDCGHHASPDLLVRHTVNYLLAADVAGTVAAPGPLLDVGSGVGAFSHWLARRLDRPLQLADHDPAVRAVASRAFPSATVHADVALAPQAAVVTAMEVVEHVPYAAQHAFVTAAWARVRPGGVLIVSTPDERGYVGGWSGYAPHVGTLDARGLRSLLASGTGTDVAVWRIAGPGFLLGPVQRWTEPVANRAWHLAQRAAPSLTSRLVDLVGARRRSGDQGPPTPPDAAFTITRGDGPGTGMLAVARRAG